MQKIKDKAGQTGTGGWRSGGKGSCMDYYNEESEDGKKVIKADDARNQESNVKFEAKICKKVIILK